MIVTEDNVHTALTYLAIDPHPLALAKRDLSLAESHLSYTFAVLHQLTDGTVKERECIVELSKDYVQARRDLAEAIFEVERHKARQHSSDNFIEVWRSENANARVAEKLR